MAAMSQAGRVNGAGAPEDGSGRRRLLTHAAGLTLLWATSSAWALPDYPITSGQRRDAQRVAQAGVPLSELSPDAPDRYQVKRGDTLWDISGLFLRRPWRWPELWGMNLQQIRNPHLIFPGQLLLLNKANGRAWLSLDQGVLPTVRLSPRVRSENLAEAAIPPIPLGVIAPFLNEALIVDENSLAGAARIVAAPENRVLLSQGDRAYARGQYGEAGHQSGQPLRLEQGSPRLFRVFRNAVALKDPASGEILGHEAQYVGRAELERGEGVLTGSGTDGTATAQIVPATIDITQAKEEIRVGDRLLPEPPRELPVFIPHEPEPAQQGQVVSVYGNAVRFAGQNQVVTINRGARDGLERGHVLALLKDSGMLRDKTDAASPDLRLPGERNGLMIVFRAFERVSYALVLQITDGVKVGDRFVNP
ncbi:LysM peptidoglycan-binding domain-containing protein [Malikia sp.]|uniref:LysM peptidoglycan-binding domain-containing protein n=1 Tax=Malikia sp. TaxID=2070706 RepID=UPI00260AC078|nr:LysM domain-containing protein [Malikia sp.]MDD2730285.1 LysM domain-containing protein [Malikia sp.]